MAPANDGGNFAIQRPTCGCRNEVKCLCRDAASLRPTHPGAARQLPLRATPNVIRFLLTVRAAHESLTILALFSVENLRFETHNGIAEIVFDIERNKSENCSPHRAPCCTPRP